MAIKVLFYGLAGAGSGLTWTPAKSLKFMASSISFVSLSMAIISCSIADRCMKVVKFSIKYTILSGKYKKYLWDKIKASLAFFFLQLERNSSHWTSLNSLHQVCNKSSNLISHSLGRNNGDFSSYLLINMEIEGQSRVIFLDDDTSRFLDSLCSNTLQGNKILTASNKREKNLLQSPWFMNYISPPLKKYTIVIFKNHVIFRTQHYSGPTEKWFY